MEDTDEIALVAFSTSARIALPLTRTTETGKKLVKRTV
jgi:Mg-chelatase subunit ChlD